jgi:threonine dehydrogenase-like Zn-dependent dehydrogenase
MLSLWLENQRLSVRDDIPVPEAPDGESLVRVLVAGICATDLELTRGYYPYTGIPGHEFVGVVERGPGELVGQRVVGEINVSCNTCSHCVAGRPTHCSNRTVLGIVGRNGAFAEYLSLPNANLHEVPEHVSTDVATFTEPLAAALEIQEQVKVTANDRVLVVGDGRLGQLVAQTMALIGCELLVIGKNNEKLSILSARGIETGISGALEPSEFDIAVECTGNPDGFAIAQSALRPRGTLVMKSTYAGRLTLDAAALVVNEITLVGSRCGPFEPALELLAKSEVDVEPMIHARYPLSEGVAAFERATRPEVLKVLLDVSPTANQA